MSTQMYSRTYAKYDLAAYAFLAGVCFAGFAGSTLAFFAVEGIVWRVLLALTAIGFLHFVDICGRAAVSLGRLLRSR